MVSWGDLRNIGLDGIGSLDNDPVVSVEGIVEGKGASSPSI